MPDGTRRNTFDAAEDAAVTGDERLVAGVGRRLVLWAAGTTLLVLVALGIALYAAVDQSLSSSGVRQLEARAEAMRRAIEGPGGRPDGDDLPTGIVFGGGLSGTFALVLGADGKIIVPRNVPPSMNQPDLGSLKAAQASGRDVREGSVSGTPVRILTTPLKTQIGTVFVQIFQDRTAEERTLAVLLAVLLGGGIVVLLVATGVGTVYSRRALIPIRASLASQRRALRRQREFAADASHELRTPLTVVRASLDLLRRHPDAPVRQVGDALDDIGAEVDNLTHLVEDLLLLARTDSGAVPLERLPIDLGDVVADAASALVSAAGQRAVRISVDPVPAMVRGDAARIRQLVLILVDNAIRHSPPDGEVRVSVRVDGPTGVLLVEDEGPGIPDEDVPHVFERFWRGAGAPAGGSGLGLSIASWIVAGHDGSIQVTNGDPVGARFAVRIPLDRGPAAG
ncbi:MAG: HAMP domain-containing sensor histidine kinase [Chloroflexota bacterium]